MQINQMKKIKTEKRLEQIRKNGIEEGWKQMRRRQKEKEDRDCPEVVKKIF